MDEKQITKNTDNLITKIDTVKHTTESKQSTASDWHGCEYDDDGHGRAEPVYVNRLMSRDFVD